LEFGEKFFTEKFNKKLFALAILLIILISFRSILDLFLLTFIFTYLLYNLHKFLHTQINRLIPVPRIVVTIIIYAALVTLIILVLLKYIPQLIVQLQALIDQITNFNIAHYEDKIDPQIIELINTVDISSYIKEAGDYLLKTVTNVGRWSLNIFLAIVLSLFYIVGKKELTAFGEKLQKSRVAFLCNYFVYFGKNFLNSFGRVMQMQIIIASVNAVLSFILLLVMQFPMVLGLAFMIFALGLIPVAGVIISLIPLSIIAFKIGGITKVIWVILMIILLHFLESYFLNPKIMATGMKLPTFVTFVILIFGEHFMGVWGLLIGIPLFFFLLDLVEVKV